MPAHISCPEQSFAYHLARDTWLPSAVTQDTLDLPRTAEAPRLARQSVQHRAGAQLDHPEREIVEILMTELVTNAVVHAGRGAGEKVIIRFAVAPERVRVEVCDRGTGFSPDDLGKPRAEPGGYGLMMVDRGASRWGTSVEEGTCVWFELDRNGAGG